MKARGLTLVEVIVVISVVGLLMTLLLPALGAAREEARSALCQTHIHQLQIYFKQYADAEEGLLPYGFDFGRWPPPPTGFAGDLRRDMLGWWWFQYLDVVNRTSLKDSGLLECPSKNLDDPVATRDLIWGNYGVNQSLCKWIQTDGATPHSSRSISVNDIHHPGQKLLIVDGGYALVSWLLATDEPPEPFKDLSMGTPYVPGLSINKNLELESGVKDDAYTGRHSGKTLNIGFVDGHVERKQADYLLVKKTGEDSYPRRDALWEP